MRGVLWLISSIAYLDFTHENLLFESSLLGMVTKGGLTYRDAAALPFDLYEYAVQKMPVEIKEVMEKKSGG